MTRDAEILSIGDELLRGVVADTNTHWLAQRIAARGARLRRAALLPDDPPVVAEALRASLARRPALVVTQGGLGPTDDDRTREAVALAIGVPLEPNSAAEEIVRRRYAELAAQGAVAEVDLTEARRAMTRLPQGAIALDNQVGTAPGVCVRTGETTVLSLPGVPPELHWIWESSAAGILDEVLGPGGFAESTVTLELLDESRIAHVMRLLQERHPDVYVKSRASGFAEGDEVRATLTAFGEDDVHARVRVDAALTDLRAALAAEGIPIRG